MFAPELCDCAVDPATPLVQPVKLFAEMPVNEIYSRFTGVAVFVESSLSTQITPGATSPVVVVSATVVSDAVIAPFNVVAKAFIEPVSHNLAAIVRSLL